MINGSSKYLDVAAVALIRRMHLILLMGGVVIFLLSNIEDLAILTACLDHLKCQLRQSLMVDASKKMR
jgi:hypothetical protein